MLFGTEVPLLIAKTLSDIAFIQLTESKLQKSTKISKVLSI